VAPFCLPASTGLTFEFHSADISISYELRVVRMFAAYCNATRIAMSPCPLARGCSAFNGSKARPKRFHQRPTLKREESGGPDSNRERLDSFHYWSAMSIGMRACPPVSGRSALPMTAPNDLPWSMAFIACPNVGEVVKRSPISMDPCVASALQ
jgi:hypothetical protein